MLSSFCMRSIASWSTGHVRLTFQFPPKETLTLSLGLTSSSRNEPSSPRTLVYVLNTATDRVVVLADIGEAVKNLAWRLNLKSHLAVQSTVRIRKP